MSTSAFYYKPKIDPVAKLEAEMDLVDRIEQIHVEFPDYGYRRIHLHILQEDGEIINSKKIRRIMKKYDQFPMISKSFKIATTDSNHAEPIYPNLLPGMALDGINQVWASDITYIRIRTCFVYLAVIMDLYSRRIIGWAISTSLRSELCLEALKMALANRKPPKGCIHHSDRGVQYACQEYIALLKENNFFISMSAKGNPYDNAFLESLMKTLKYGEILLKEYETMTDVLNNLPRFIEEVYNKKRLHSGIGYMAPEKFELKLLTMKPEERPILNL